MSDSAWPGDAADREPPLEGEDLAEEWAPLLAQLAAAADLCLKPWRHAVRFSGPPPATVGCRDLSVWIEARDPDGARWPEGDLELEIYRSGDDLNLMLTRLVDDAAPLLWHGRHAVWMHGASGQRCERPQDGAPLEALARRIRALVAGGD